MLCWDRCRKFEFYGAWDIVGIEGRNITERERCWCLPLSMPHISSRSGVVSKGNAVIGWAQASSALRE
jgi:hypothetical protein